MSTNLHTATLAHRQQNERPDDRVSLRRLRVALIQLLTGARPEPSHAWDDVAREQPRAPLPCAKERAMIHAAIRQGKTTPERVMAYRLAQLEDDLRQFEARPAVDQIVYVTIITESAEAMDALSVAHALPTSENVDRALRETREAVTMGEMACAYLEQRRPLAHVVPMGVSR